MNLTLSKKLEENNVLLVKISGVGYNEVLAESARELHELGRLCFVSLSRPFSSFAKLLQKKGVSLKDVYVISVKDGEATEAIESPGNFYELGVALTNALDKGCTVILFESPLIVFRYAKVDDAVKFYFESTKKARSRGAKVVFAVRKELAEELVRELYFFVDDVVDVGTSETAFFSS